jgi:signal transduction histidine kinase
MFERYRRLSHELLKYSSLGLLRKDFLPKVSEKILAFSGADATELWVKEDSHKHLRCSLTRSTKMPFGFILVPCPLGEETAAPPYTGGELNTEKLCCDVINGKIDPSHPYVTHRGSFWTDDTSREVYVEGLAAPSTPPLPTRLPDPYPSIALIPIRIEQECIGLLQLKSRRKGFFTIHDLSFYEDISEVLGVALPHQYAQIELRERVKELTCLFGIARVVAQTAAPFDAIVQEIANLLPPAWLYPEIACARIVLNGKSYSTKGFRETPYHQSSDVVVDNQNVGFVEVAYLEKKLTMDEGPFLAEERNLIDSVAREVAIFYQRTRADEEKALLQDQLRHADRLATIGQLAAGVAHELNEPLANILGFAQLAKKAPALPTQTEKDLKSIESASLHAREIIRKLMTFSRQLPPKKALVNLNDVVKEGLYFFEARCSRAGIRLVLELAQTLPQITIDAGQMNQVLVNLVVNAIQAMPKGGTLTVRTRALNGAVQLIVEDTGTGMSEELKHQIFLPFFTTKDIHEGTGLGLAVVHGIVTSHGGEISVETRTGEGTTFSIHLPLENREKV